VGSTFDRERLRAQLVALGIAAAKTQTLKPLIMSQRRQGPLAAVLQNRKSPGGYFKILVFLDAERCRNRALPKLRKSDRIKFRWLKNRR
jgi:hypothetical protein